MLNDVHALTQSDLVKVDGFPDEGSRVGRVGISSWALFSGVRASAVRRTGTARVSDPNPQGDSNFSNRGLAG